MAGNLYDLGTLLEVLRITKKPTPFFLERFFRQQINFTTQEILFDRVYTDDRKMAPFVVPNVQGRVMGMSGYDTKSFKPAYVKPKHVVDPNMVLPRQPGEIPFSGSMSPEDRRRAVIAQLTQDHRNLLSNRNEWLAAQALVYGSVVIKGEDYPTTLVDFGRDAALTATLTGGARWSEVGADPLENLKTMRMIANDKSGARITQHVFGGEAWDLFSARVNLKELMDTRYGGQESRVNLMADGYEGYEYMGVIQGLNGTGRIEAWVHTGKLVDPETNTEEYVIPQNGVLGVSEAVQGHRCFGAIKDFDANLQALEMFMKNWRNEDPSVEYLLSQSAPLMVPKQPDATFWITVADPIV